MPSCQKTDVTPSPLLILICLILIRRSRPDWVAVSVRDACRGEGVSPERMSRLASGALCAFEAAVATLTRIGRPASDRRAVRGEQERHLLRALLGVATSVLQQATIRSDVVRHLVVGAWERLHTAHPSLTLDRFTETMGISSRTFRDWRKRTTSRPPPEGAVTMPPRKPPPPPRPPRRPRFSLAVTLPDTQLAADTTNLTAFGVPLKLVAAQDIGGRDTDLLEAVIIDDHEDSEAVIAVLKEALGDDAAGKIVLTDQGTPYMARDTVEALEGLGVEHAPQREYDARGKATIERAFGIVKPIAEPILSLTNDLAEALPRLRAEALAKAGARILITALLRAYQVGARAMRRGLDERGSIDPRVLAELSEESREKARAHERSARLLLEHFHEAFGFDISRDRFVRTFRRYPAHVLKDAGQRFASQAHRDDIKVRSAYFGKLVRLAFERHRADRDARRATEADLERTRAERHATRDELRRLRDHPHQWLASALRLLALHWRPAKKALLFGGVGPGTAALDGSLRQLVEAHGPRDARDIANAVLGRFARTRPHDIDDHGIDAILDLARSHLDRIATPGAYVDFPPDFPTCILRSTGPPPRPATSTALRT